MLHKICLFICERNVGHTQIVAFKDKKFELTVNRTWVTHIAGEYSNTRPQTPTKYHLS